MSKYVRWIIACVVIAGVIAGAFLLVQSKKQALEQAPAYGGKPRVVTVSTAESGTFSRQLHYLTVVAPAQSSNLSAPVTAEILKVHVDEGDTVAAGDLLAELDDSDVRHRVEVLSAQVEQAQAELAANQATVESLQRIAKYRDTELERAKNLEAKDVIAPSVLDRRESEAAEATGKLQAARQQGNAIHKRIAALQRQVKEAEARLADYAIRSPYVGTVAERLVDPGDLGSPQRTLIRVEDRSSLKLVFDVPQSDLPGVRQGLSVRLSAGGDKRTAELSLLHPSLTPARMKRAEVRLSDALGDGLAPGMTVSASVVLQEQEDVTLVPRSSVIASPERQATVFVVENKRLAARPVEVLGHTGDRAAVSGVKPGERVVRNTFLGWARLASGEAVEAVE